MKFFKNVIAPICIAGTLALGANPAHAKVCGQASWYGPGLYGNLTANGEVLRQGTMTAAHPYLPLGSWVRVVNQDNGRVASIRINDRGPYYGGRIIDLAHGAARQLGLTVTDIANVCVSRL
jgi:rare lipoprotein A